MIAHTPSPWALSDFSKDMIIDSNGDLIALIIDGEPEETKFSNARLIAASPELLEALKEARNGLIWYQEMNSAEVSACDAEAMERIEAAITKATGETK